jgi:hypothetical protein
MPPGSVPPDSVPPDSVLSPLNEQHLDNVLLYYLHYLLDYLHYLHYLLDYLHYLHYLLAASLR